MVQLSPLCKLSLAVARYVEIQLIAHGSVSHGANSPRVGLDQDTNS